MRIYNEMAIRIGRIKFVDLGSCDLNLALLFELILKGLWEKVGSRLKCKLAQSMHR